MIGTAISILSESLLALYPVLIQITKLPLGIQVFARFLVYSALSAGLLVYFNAFPSLSVIFSASGLFFGLVNTIHIISSYIGFSRVSPGIANTLFYGHSLTNVIFGYLLFSDVVHPLRFLTSFFLAITGTYIIVADNQFKADFIGLLGILISGISESGLYVASRYLNVGNELAPVQTVFTIYIIPFIISSLILFIKPDYLIEGLKQFEKKYTEFKENSLADYLGDNVNPYVILVLTGIIGATGYILRFYAANMLDVEDYSILIFVGVITAYLSGYFVLSDPITINQIMGTLFIVSSQFFV